MLEHGRLYLVAAVLSAVAVATGPVVAEEGDTPTNLFGAVSLAPGDGAPFPDAAGAAYLRERADRSAIHVYVRGLEPGATYDVAMALEDQTETIGTITTHDGEAGDPRCFKAKLRVPEDDGAAPAGDGGHWWPFHFPWGDPRGVAFLTLNGDRTVLYYGVGVWGLEGAVTSLTLVIGEESIELDAEKLNGSIEVTEEQVAGLVAGEGSIAVATDADEALSGAVTPCLSEEWRQRIAEHRAGKGALRIDTARGDALPLGAASIADLVGAEITVADGEGTTVLAGTVDEVLEQPCWWRACHDDGTDSAGGGGAMDDDPDGFFSVDERHDASFLRGDSNDDGDVDVSDAVTVLGYLYRGSAAPYCKDAADADDNGEVELTDAVLVLQVLFRGDGVLAGPSDQAGFDPTPDVLFCEQ